MDRNGNSRAGGNNLEQTFRTWLIEQLKLSRWSVMSRETVTDAAKRLGVQEDALEQAISERASGKKLHAPRQLAEQRHLKLWMPDTVHQDWMEYCKVLGVTSAILLRSLVQRYLLDPVTTPTMLDRRWIYRNKRHIARAETRVDLQSRISRGAQQALDYRSRQLRITAANLMKGLVVDLLEGRTRQVKIVTAAEMWGDPKRYLNPELFR